MTRPQIFPGMWRVMGLRGDGLLWVCPILLLSPSQMGADGGHGQPGIVTLPNCQPKATSPILPPYETKATSHMQGTTLSSIQIILILKKKF